MKLCECGCGQPTPIAKVTFRSRGHVKGQPIRFIRFHSNRRRIRKIDAALLEGNPRQSTDVSYQSYVVYCNSMGVKPLAEEQWSMMYSCTRAGGGICGASLKPESWDAQLMRENARLRWQLKSAATAPENVAEQNTVEASIDHPIQ